MNYGSLWIMSFREEKEQLHHKTPRKKASPSWLNPRRTSWVIILQRSVVVLGLCFRPLRSSAHKVRRTSWLGRPQQQEFWLFPVIILEKRIEVVGRISILADIYFSCCTNSFALYYNIQSLLRFLNHVGLRKPNGLSWAEEAGQTGFHLSFICFCSKIFILMLNCKNKRKATQMS